MVACVEFRIAMTVRLDVKKTTRVDFYDVKGSPHSWERRNFPARLWSTTKSLVSGSAHFYLRYTTRSRLSQGLSGLSLMNAIDWAA